MFVSTEIMKFKFELKTLFNKMGVLFTLFHSFTSAAYMDVCHGIRSNKFRYKWLDVEKAPFVSMADRSFPIRKMVWLRGTS